MADFELTVKADDSAIGATGGPVEDSDFAHVRNYVRGILVQLEGGLPLGWTLELTELAETGDQQAFAGNVHEAPKVVPIVRDRFTEVQEGECATCAADGRPGVRIAAQSDGIWYHLAPCANPTPIVSDDPPVDL